jgi:hypothetical protein
MRSISLPYRCLSWCRNAVKLCPFILRYWRKRCLRLGVKAPKRYVRLWDPVTRTRGLLPFLAHTLRLVES